MPNQPGGTHGPTLSTLIYYAHSERNFGATEHAARIARAALACAEAGSVAKAVMLSMDIEQDLYEANRLQDAASLLNRILKGTE